jgi:hypothetical protein
MCMGGGGAEIEETELEQETARIALDKFNTLRPELEEAENFYIDKVQEMNDAGEYSTLAKQIGVTSNAQFDETGRAVAANLNAQGVDPTSGKYQTTLDKVSKSAGQATSDAVNKGQTTQQDNALTGLSNVVAMGEGESAQAIDGMMDITNISSSYARQKASEEAQAQSNQQGSLAFLAGAGYEASNGTGG